MQNKPASDNKKNKENAVTGGATDRKLLSSLGLAMKAGKTVCGCELVREAARDGKIKLMVLSKKAAENTVTRIRNCAGFYGVRLIETGRPPSELGAALGKGDISVVGITDTNFRKLIEKSVADVPDALAVKQGKDR